MSIPKLRKAVNLRLQPMIEGLSFHKQSEGVYFVNMGNEALGRLGLPDTTRTDYLGIYPVVGLRHILLEAVCFELSGKKPKRYGSPTVNIVLGYLTPQKTFLEWRFTGEGDDESYAGLIDAIRIYGLPFLNANASTEGIDKLMESYDYISRHERAKKWPVVKLLLGKRDEAMQVMDDYLALLEREGRDGAVQEYETYRALVVERADWIENLDHTANR